MVTALAPQAIADQYRQTSARFMRQAEYEFERGDLLQASEKSWNAAVQHLKALATLRGMSHNDHWNLRLVARQMVDETGNERIGELFGLGEGLHSNFYEQWMPEAEVRARMNNMRELIDLLRSVPTPNGSVPIRPNRGRTFFRDRGDG